MKNKILIQLIVPELEEKYDVFIPVNRRIGSIVEILNKTLYEITSGIYNIENSDRLLYNSKTGEKYNAQDLVRNTNIRNGTKIVLL